MKTTKIKDFTSKNTHSNPSFFNKMEGRGYTTRSGEVNKPFFEPSLVQLKPNAKFDVQRKPKPDGDTDDPVVTLSEQARQDVKRDITFSLSLASDAFNSALTDNVISNKAAAKAKAEITALLLEVAFGFINPALAKGIASIANAIPKGSSIATYRIALAALDASRTEKILGAVVKTGSQAVKSSSTKLFGMTDIDQFAAALRVAFQKGFYAIGNSSNLNSLSDIQLISTVAAYHPDVVNYNVYLTLIKDLFDKFEKYVLPIGTKGAIQPPTGIGVPLKTKTGAAWVKDEMGDILILAMEVEGTGNLKFIDWVDKDVKEVAMSRANQIQGSIPVVTKDGVRDLPRYVPRSTARATQ